MCFHLLTVIFIRNPLLIHLGFRSTFYGFFLNLFNFIVLNRPQLVKLEIYSTSTNIIWFPKNHA